MFGISIWKNMPKSDFHKETDENKKVTMKGELYTEIEKIYLEKEGRSVKRSTIRRCVNSIK